MERIRHYFPELSESQLEQFSQLKELYSYWNSQINVVSRKDIDELYERHVLHSLGIAKVIRFKANTKIMDVGTGGGFPGIPLAILFPEANFYLIDSIGKKIKVVNEVSKALGLKNLQAEQKRAEEVPQQFHFIVSRAVTRLKEFHGWVGNKIRKDQFNDLKNGILYLKGLGLDEEIAESKLQVKLYPLKDYFQETFFETKAVWYI